MPRNLNTPVLMETLSLEERKALPERAQEHWYILAGRLFSGLSVLDVGSGAGSGPPAMRARGVKSVAGIDLLPAHELVYRLPIEAIKDAAFDAVACMDVLEHVEDGTGLLAHLLRVCRLGVLLSTPNYNAWHCQNPYHVKEYTPAELSELLQGKEYLAWTVGADRVHFPMRAMAALSECDSCFGVLVRGSGCTDEKWASWKTVPADGITDEVLRCGRHSDEWVSEITALLSGCTTIQGMQRLTEWIDKRLILETGVASLASDDSILILRHGYATSAQQRTVFHWILDHVWKR